MDQMKMKYESADDTYDFIIGQQKFQFSVFKKIHAKQAFEINFIYFLYSSGCWKLWLCIGQSSIREKHCPPFGGWW